MIGIQLPGASKMLVGLSEAGWDILKSQRGHLSLNIGLSFKDKASGEFLSGR